ncbi:hypothetical protein [Ottowia oryzae]
MHTASLAGEKSSAMFQAQAITSRWAPWAEVMKTDAPVLIRRYAWASSTGWTVAGRDMGMAPA